MFTGLTFSVEPKSRRVLDGAVIMEPRTLTESGNGPQMTLFVKTDKSVLQTINLEGQATSALLDTVEVTKAIRLGLANMQFDYETTPVTSNCCHDKT